MAEERPWTKARCTRLLRPLTTSLASLRNDRKGSCVGIRSSKTVQDHGAALKLDGFHAPNAITEEFDWAQRNSRKRVKRTYRDRGMSKPSIVEAKGNTGRRNATATNPGELLVSTPLLQKKPTSAVFNTNMPRQARQLDYEVLQCKRPTSDSLACRNRKMTPIEAVKTSLITLLHQTRPYHYSRRLGAKTLFSLCLQNVPEHIADEELWRKEQNPEDKSDVSADVYDFLENLGIGSRTGWKPLREAVRAHGMFLITSAIETHSLPLAEVESLFDVCVQHDALAEAKRLVYAWTNAHKEFPQPRSPWLDCFQLERMLDVVSSKVNSSAFQCRLLAELMRSKKLPVDWACTDAFKPLWYRLIHSMFQQNDDCEEAMEFSKEILILFANDESSHRLDKANELDSWFSDQFLEAVENTAFSLCSALCAITILTGKSGTICIASSEHLAGEPSRQAFRQGLTSRMYLHGMEALIKFYAVFKGTDTAMEDLEHSISQLMITSDFYDCSADRASTSRHLLSRFVCSAVRYHGRSRADTGFDLLSVLVRSMLDYTPRSSDDKNVRISFVRRWALESLMLCTDTMSSPEHAQLLQNAEHLVRCLDAAAKLRRNSRGSRRSSKAYYGTLRWEEGICEWVVATPATMSKARPGLSASFASPIPQASRPASCSIAASFSQSRDLNPPAFVECTPSSISVSNPMLDLDCDEHMDSGIFIEDNVKSRVSGRSEASNSQREIDLESFESTPIDNTKLNVLRTFGKRKRSAVELPESGVRQRLSQRKRYQEALDAWDLTSDELG